MVLAAKVFSESTKVKSIIQMNLTAFNFCNLFSLQSKSNCHKISEEEVNQKAAVFVITFEVSCFFRFGELLHPLSLDTYHEKLQLHFFVNMLRCI